jgi:hypothetical protein
MDFMPNWIDRAGRIVSASVVVLSLLAGAAHAKPWAKFAPAPLASDSAYAALSALPADSLGTDELSWVDVQRDWRAARRRETEPDSRSVSSPTGTHVARANDGRFAALASRPYASLTSSERAWLVLENAAQRAERSGGNGGSVVGIILIAAALGALLSVWIVGNAIDSGFDDLFGN